MCKKNNKIIHWQIAVAEEQQKKTKHAMTLSLLIGI